MDWPILVPIVSWIMNSQISAKTGYSPSELFLGRPSWRLEIFPEPDSTPTVSDFLQHQMELQEAAMKRLQKLRQISNKNSNKRGSEPGYHVGDYVLVSRDRWPQRKLKKVECQWFGPFRILEVRHNTLKVAVSPSLGGEAICAYSQVKHGKVFSEPDLQLLDSNDFQPDNENSDDFSEAQALPQRPVVNQNSVENNEVLPPGYFMVSKILGHKYSQGWRFLTAWEGYPIASATWEPIKNFKHDNGTWNSVFEEYCWDNALPFPPSGKGVRQIPDSTSNP